MYIHLYIQTYRQINVQPYIHVEKNCVVLTRVPNPWMAIEKSKEECKFMGVCKSMATVKVYFFVRNAESLS